MSDILWLVDFAIGLVNSVFNLPDGQVIFFEEFEKQKNCEIKSAVQKAFGLAEMTSGLVNVSFSLPEWQAVKMIFFASCTYNRCYFFAFSRRAKASAKRARSARHVARQGKPTWDKTATFFFLKKAVLRL